MTAPSNESCACCTDTVPITVDGKPAWHCRACGHRWWLWVPRVRA